MSPVKEVKFSSTGNVFASPAAHNEASRATAVAAAAAAAMTSLSQRAADNGTMTRSYRLRRQCTLSGNLLHDAAAACCCCSLLLRLLLLAWCHYEMNRSTRAAPIAHRLL